MTGLPRVPAEYDVLELSLDRVGAAPSDFSYPSIGPDVVTASNLLARFWPWAVFAWPRCVGRFCVCSEGLSV